MADLLEHVSGTLRDRRLLEPGEPALVAVSGGVDSMVLLHLLHELAVAGGWALTVAHLNHGLRGRSSEADERLVRRVAGALGLDAIVERADVRAFARQQKLSLEMAARKVRHGFLARTAAQRGMARIALAHHANDQLELFFLRLFRGGGGEGLAGMKWLAPSPSDPRILLARPLLDLDKTVLEEYASTKRIPFRQDATNRCLDIPRNRIRHQLLPLIRRQYQPAVSQIVLRTMEVLGAETEFVTETARQWLRKEGFLSGAYPKFEKLPVAIQRACVHVQLLGHGLEPSFDVVEQLRLSQAAVSVTVRRRSCGESMHPVAADLCGRAVRSCAGKAGDAGKDLEPLVVCRGSDGLIRLRVPEELGFDTDSVQVTLAGRRGSIDFAQVHLRWCFRAGGLTELPAQVAGQEWFDADRVGARVSLRHWRPGDRFQPSGLKAPVKLQDLFTNQKVPREQRRRLLVGETQSGELFWVEGLRIAERFKLTRTTKRCLLWAWHRV